MREALRSTIELIVFIAVAVSLTRTWIVESYVIPTGSMAESLWGAHRRVVCHDCGWTFAVGCDAAQQQAARRAVCPNCGFSGNMLEPIPCTPGDRLLVWKTAYALRQPRRWEPVVFRSPEQPDTTYVKRVVGLPGELVEVRQGDVYIDGRLARKPLGVQRAIALVVNDTRFRSPRVRARWRSDAPHSGWQSTDEGHFFYQPPADAKAVRLATQVQPPRNPSRLNNWLVYHHQRRLPEGLHGQMAIERHGAADNVVEWPVEDLYGYNQSLPRREEETHTVGDLLLRCRFRTWGAGRLWFWATNGHDRLAVCAEQGLQATRWFHNGRVVRKSSLELWSDGQWVEVELSIIDHQMIVSWNGRETGRPYVFEPPATQPPHAVAARSDAPNHNRPHGRAGSGEDVSHLIRGSGGVPSRPLAIGAEGLRVEIAWIAVLRDVYYTAGPAPIAGSSPTTRARLKSHQFFVLGDNSPLSYDSRAWNCGPALDERLLVGRPMVVHLPMRTIGLGRVGRVFRIPDLARIRYIR